MKRKETLFLIDSMGIAYRSYFAFIQNPLINSRGENTSAIYGFVNYLNKILDEQRPDYVAAVFDTDKPTFRHEAFADYKATRNKMPDDMAASLGYLKEVVRAYNIPVLELDGYEADDIIGTLARKAEKEGIASYLVTSDKDFMQLVSPLIRLYRPGKFGSEDEVVDERGVMEKFGVAPERVIDMLGLIGDTSDNVPGVKGIGQKTALPLIQKFTTIENILEHLDEVSPKGVQEKLRNGRESALLSKSLVTIHTEVPIQADIHHLKAAAKDVATLLSLFDRLEFKTFARRLREQGTAPTPVPAPEATPSETAAPLSDITTEPHTYRIVRTDKEYLRLLSALKKASAFVFDTETTSTDPLRAELVGISFCITAGDAYYLPVVVPDAPRGEGDLFAGAPAAPREGFPVERVVKDLRGIFADPAIGKYGQNIKYDMLVLSAVGIETAGVAFDTMVAAYTLRSDRQHSLDSLAAEHLRYRMVSFSELTDGGKKDIREVPLDELGNYSAEDADMTCRLVDVLHGQTAAAGLQSLCTDIEFPLIEVLARMERRGVRIDTAFLAEMSLRLGAELEKLVAVIHAHAGAPFNINSTQQLAVVLFETLKLPPAKKTKTGYSTDVAVLETLRKAHPIVESLLEYRQLQKLKSTYIDALPKLIHPADGRVHTSFNQTVAATGRLSSSDPNLQNIPIRTDIGRSIRKAFVASDASSLILSADYSQIELRIMAHVCGDPALTEAFRNREDIHATTAARVFGVPPGEVSREMRRKAKEVNFGIMYGIGPFGLASRLDISQAEARDIIQRYFERFPKVNQYIADTIAAARTNGYVQTLRGRRRYIPDIANKNQNIRSNAERQAINMPIQGSAADMIKLAMVAVDREMRRRGMKGSMVLQVHDELVFDIPKKEEKTMRELVEREMTGAMPLTVPVEVEMGSGTDWLEAH